MDELNDYNQRQMLTWVCMAIDLDLCDEHGTVVWSRDNSKHDLEGARKALRALGMTDNQLAAIFKASRDLTDSTQEVRAQD